ncbi:hypothetical protein L211DRAFT_517047 [Terfezia boudieri ATCC MYA-4762]|uniref:Uncharacterized protein n=1 Tax=Terfezia boudieri ATCC MYA-4762 TaxID=1051890 RepID=A0A3N4LRD5_9PEZI|nr:hypothetical protein L211DRAFT_361439 [Terfezia boudieri ATCC MYA-4762]RPB20545.1 hypothetical protein L211DRAFT_517047 [Terfezia boudieri ATCC MYA-4762]
MLSSHHLSTLTLSIPKTLHHTKLIHSRVANSWHESLSPLRQLYLSPETVYNVLSLTISVFSLPFPHSVFHYHVQHLLSIGVSALGLAQWNYFSFMFPTIIVVIS